MSIRQAASSADLPLPNRSEVPRIRTRLGRTFRPLITAAGRTMSPWATRGGAVARTRSPILSARPAWSSFGRLAVAAAIVSLASACPSATAPDPAIGGPTAPPPQVAIGGSGEGATPLGEGSSSGEATEPPDTAAPTAPEPAPETPEPPPDLALVLARAGFTESETLGVMDFVQVPAGAFAQAGRFHGEVGDIDVAMVTYPNDRFAGPHVRDIEERRRVLATSGEAVLSRGPTVVHLRALEREIADAAAHALADALGWPAPAAPGPGEPAGSGAR